MRIKQTKSKIQTAENNIPQQHSGWKWYIETELGLRHQKTAKIKIGIRGGVAYRKKCSLLR